MSVQYETELYEPLKIFFEQQGYTIKGEVRLCDLVGVKEGAVEPLIVEMKKTFNLSLLLQGMERLKMSSNVYLAVERSRAKRGAVNQRWGELSVLCRRLGLGLITITFYKTKQPFVEVLTFPTDQVIPLTKNKRRQSRLIDEFHERSGDYNVGGSTRTKLITSYREKALRIALPLRDADSKGLSPLSLRNTTGIGNASAILQHNYYGWFVRVSRGRYILTPLGMSDLVKYQNVIDTEQN
ncbi:DUF2161 family putative PD-(D/E)XK-type phosphodiesterase [Paenibacillus crassostreae]|uniref:Uncharacterized protein n=1 Tax=Paenibacillus crassostreae TaxID=1763538 RepID=A0A167GSJ8_9BACL|nr:DUF2161 family putative PD-(D/E)XK-type phosphodiesterase [Paenibacillus crassostreae]AOZ92052.1 hypothetical protein LPB68_07335 [Paenibacillus crassostreae]OAB77861.1 hypothetical protein PNBC_00415 [Paenibacillus crassostreae]